MIMQRLGKQLSRHPKATIAATIAITLIATGCIQIFGITQEFSEEPFMRKMELVKISYIKRYFAFLSF